MAPSIRLGEYELLCELGSGGMATLYVARHVGVADVERLVAVKRVHRHVLAAAGGQTMFRDEARLASLVRHPNVVRVLDIAEVDGELLIVLDYIESVSLSGLQQAARAAGERVPVAIAVRVLADALAGLHAAHEATDVRGEPLGIVHRDFSPQNVLVGIDGTSHLIDFGIAKAAVRATDTQSGVLKGKFQYMSPEQARGGTEIDRRSDVFSAGVVLFEAITGASPFGEDHDPSAVLLRIVLDPVPVASSLAPGIPAELDAVVARALERIRGERYQTADDMRAALVAAVAPASDADVQAAVGAWCHASLASRREIIHRALIGTGPALAGGERRSDETAPTVVERPSTAPTAVERPPVSRAPKPRSMRARIAIGGGAITIVASVLFVVWWHGRFANDDPDETAIAIESPPLARADAGTIEAISPPDTAVIDAAVSVVDAPPVRHPAPPTSRPTSTRVAPPPPNPGSPRRTRIEAVTGFTADGALLWRDHQVRARPSLVANTTAVPDAAIESALVKLTSFILQNYRLAASSVAADKPIPHGIVTVEFTLDHGAFMPLPRQTSSLDDAQTSAAVERSLLAAIGHALKSGPKEPTGRIVVAVTVSVQ